MSHNFITRAGTSELNILILKCRAEEREPIIIEIAFLDVQGLSYSLLYSKRIDDVKLKMNDLYIESKNNKLLCNVTNLLLDQANII